MMRSLFSGVSGLRVHQTKMDVIANNIANVNTVGYKTSRTTFKDAFYQKLMGATGPNLETVRPGTNPEQIGLGANINSIDNIMTQGAAQRTDNAFDAMIQGNGFFIVQNEAGERYFTRAGNIKLDSQMNLHIDGRNLMGWDAIWDNDAGEYRIDKGSPVVPLDLKGDKQHMPPKATTIVEFVGNLNPNELNEDNKLVRTMSIYDSLGSLLKVDVEFTYHPDANDPNNTTHTQSVWTYEFLTGADTTSDPPKFGVVAYLPGDTERANPYYILLDVDPHNENLPDRVDHPNIPEGMPEYSNSAAVTTRNMRNGGTLIFDTKGSLVYPPTDEKTEMIAFPVSVLDPTATFGDPSGDRYTVDYEDGHEEGPDGDGSVPSHAGTIYMDFTQFTQFDGMGNTAAIMFADGNTPGTIQDYSIGGDGVITGRYSNSETRALGQIPLAEFENPGGLEKIGSNLFAETANSGRFNGVGVEGNILGGSLEMSNVDMSQEFTEMIITQRGFQANSRIISVSDDMLQELVNLKR